MVTFENQNTVLEMKRLLLLPLLLFAISVSARREKIPTYLSFVYWIQGTDTIYGENNTLLHESVSPDGTVTIRVRHEDWNNTVTSKSIARMAPWHAVVSQRQGIRAIIHQGRANTDAMMPMKQVPGTMPNALNIKNLARYTDQFDMPFATEYMIENNGDQDIVINDLNRGLVWYVPPRSYLLLNMGKLPQACLLRISNTDPMHPALKYVTIGSACVSVKYTLAHEDEDCWIYVLNEEKFSDDPDKLDFRRLQGESNPYLSIRYIKRDKDTFNEVPMLEAEVFAIIRNARAEKSKK